MAGRLRQAGWAGAGLAGGIAAWTAVNRAAVRRFSRRRDTSAPGDLAMPDGLRERTVTMSDGWDIRLIELGPRTGRPVVLLHGITLSAEVWPYQMRDLVARGYRVLAVDQRGHGRSGGVAPGPAGADATDGSGAGTGAAPAGPGLTLDRLADDVAEILDRLDLSGAVLVGHSMGGMVALRLMDRRPGEAAGRGRLAGLVLVGTSANPTRGRGVPGLSDLVALSQPVVSSAAGLAARLPGPTLPAYDLAFLLARVTFGEGSSPRQVFFTGRMTSEVPVRVSAGLLLEIVRFNAEKVLGRISLPTTVVVGDHDLMTPLRQSEYMAARIAGASLVVLPGCGHMVMLERPDQLNEAVVGLVARIEGSARRDRAVGGGPGAAGRSTDPPADPPGRAGTAGGRG